MIGVIAGSNDMLFLYSFFLYLLVHLTIASKRHQYNRPCEQRWYDEESFVCVCRENNCDKVEDIGQIECNHAVVYSTDRAQNRLTKDTVRFERLKPNNKTVRARVFPSRQFQKIIGFGGAWTDAAMQIVKQLSERSPRSHLGQTLFDQYFYNGSIAYSLGRVPIGTCDFSLGNFSFAPVDQDFELEHFRLLELDAVRIENLRKVFGNLAGEFRLFASPWSPPGWMKNTMKMQGGGVLRGEFNGIYYLTLARYYLKYVESRNKFFEAYAKEGVFFWGMTVQNEPSSGLEPFYPFQTCYLSPQMQRDFVQHRLGPILRSNWVTKDIKIMAHDDQRDQLYDAAKEIYSKDHSYIDGLAVHWYSRSSYQPLNQTYHLQPNKFILSSEACNADRPLEHVPLLGSWLYAENYAHDIIQTLLNYGAGWVDWNIWLDTLGGPNWVGNFVDAPIIVNGSGNEFFKQPMYYVLGHFSKFIRPDSVRIQIKVDGYEGTENDTLEAVAFTTPSEQFVVVAHNRDEHESVELLVGVDGTNKFVKVELPPKSIRTVIWKDESKAKCRKKDYQF
ncbi:Glucosylceramidase [Aphelenchoides besseyi]|nr:Glucosylceramidase [Aphelenchoides besseyi]